jgi:hypothetical protein
MKPMRQGDLDGLCGVYAVLNAIQFLVPKARDEDYLNKLMVHIIGTCYTAKDVTAGGDEIKMASVFAYAHDKVEKDLKVTLSMTNKGRVKQFKSPADVLSISFSLGRPGVFIMGYEGRDSHWTVVRGIINDDVLLFDSCGQKKFARKDLVWRKDVKSLKTDKIVVSPGDLNWMAAGGVSM